MRPGMHASFHVGWHAGCHGMMTGCSRPGGQQQPLPLSSKPLQPDYGQKRAPAFPSQNVDTAKI